MSRHFGVAILGYLGVALLMTLPAASTLTTRFIGADSGDVYQMARHIWWFKTALASGDDIFYHALLAYPEGFGAVELWAHPLQFFPMWLFALALPLPAAYNLGVLLNLTLNGAAMYSFARRRISRARHAPAFFAGLVYMIFPVFQGHLAAGQAGLLPQWQTPLLLLALFAYVDGGKRRWLAASILLFALSAMGHSLQYVYLLLPLFSLFLLARLLRRDYVGATRTLAVFSFGSALLLLFLTPILGEPAPPQSHGSGDYARHSIDLLGLATPSYENPFWRDIATHSRDVLGDNRGEGASYIGLIGGLLMLIGAVSRRGARWWLLVAFVAWLLSLGPVLKVFDAALQPQIAGYSTVIPLPFALFMDLPVIDLAGAPGRFMVLFGVAASIMAAYGMATLFGGRVFQRRRRVLRYGMAAILALLLVGDYLFYAPFPTAPAAIPDAVHALRDRGDIRAVFNLPQGDAMTANEALYLQTAHGKPLIAGHETGATPVDRAKLTLLSTLQPALLADAGADIVLLNKARAAATGKLDALYEAARQTLGAPTYDGDRFAIFELRWRRGVMLSRPVWSTETDNGSRYVYVFKAQAGWLELRAQLNAEKRRVRMSLNGAPLQSLDISGGADLRMPLPIARRGYNTFSLALDPPCPQQYDSAALQCYGVSLDSVEIRELSRGAIYDPIRVASGIELSGYRVEGDFRDELVIHLWWSFDETRHSGEQRFIHVLDEQRRLVRQNDISFGAAEAGSDHLESVRLDFRDIAPGDYLALTGWYSLPDMVRYDVLTDVDGAQDNTIVLGRITVPG